MSEFNDPILKNLRLTIAEAWMTAREIVLDVAERNIDFGE